MDTEMLAINQGVQKQTCIFQCSSQVSPVLSFVDTDVKEGNTKPRVVLVKLQYKIVNVRSRLFHPQTLHQIRPHQGLQGRPARPAAHLQNHPPPPHLKAITALTSVRHRKIEKCCKSSAIDCKISNAYREIRRKLQSGDGAWSKGETTLSSTSTTLSWQVLAGDFEFTADGVTVAEVLLCNSHSAMQKLVDRKLPKYTRLSKMDRVRPRKKEAHQPEE
eukprot:6326750-Amphidinium_carterae.1